MNKQTQTTPADHPMLQMVARNAGIEIEPCTCGDARWPFKHNEQASGKWGHWNPLEDDGDVFRLAVAMKIEIVFNAEVGWYAKNERGVCCFADLLGMPKHTPEAAKLRRAIVVAAVKSKH